MRFSVSFVAAFVLTVLTEQQAVGEDGPHLYERDAHGRLQVNVVVDGMGPLPFLLDSGAGRTVIFRNILGYMGVEAYPFETRRIRAATGQIVVEIYPINRISALGRSVAVERIPLLPAPKALDTFGILGVDLLKGKVISFSATEGVSVSRYAYAFDAAGWTRFDGRPVGKGSLALDLNIAGVSLPVVVDTGASRSVMNRPAYEKLLAAGVVEAQDADGESRVNIFSAGGVFEAPRADFKAGAKLNAMELPFNSVPVADLPVFVFLGAKRVPAAILGMDFFKGYDFALDLRSWSLFVRDDPAKMPSVACDNAACDYYD